MDYKIYKLLVKYLRSNDFESHDNIIDIIAEYIKDAILNQQILEDVINRIDLIYIAVDSFPSCPDALSQILGDIDSELIILNTDHTTILYYDSTNFSHSDLIYASQIDTRLKLSCYISIGDIVKSIYYTMIDIANNDDSSMNNITISVRSYTCDTIAINFWMQ